MHEKKHAASTKMAEELQKQHEGLIDIIERENLVRLKADVRGQQSPPKAKPCRRLRGYHRLRRTPPLSATKLMSTLQSLIEPYTKLFTRITGSSISTLVVVLWRSLALKGMGLANAPAR